MGLIARLMGIRDIAIVTIWFREDGRARVTVVRDDLAPATLDTAALDVALFLNYAGKALYALGSSPDADALRSRIVTAGISLSESKFQPFTSSIHTPGECIGRLRMNRQGTLLMTTNYRVPVLETNDYVTESTLLTLNRAVSSQPTPQHRRRLAAAIRTLELYYQIKAEPSSLTALRGAALVAFESYRSS